MFFRLPVVRFFNHVINRATVTVALVLLQIGWLLWAFFSLTAGKVWVNAGLNVLSLFITLYLVRKDENSDYKIIWLVLIGLMPLLGGALYLAFGNKAPAKRMRQRMQAVERQHTADLAQQPGQTEALDPASRGLCRYIADYGPYPAWKDTTAKYYPCGEEMYPDLLADLEGAERFIFLEFFIVRTGRMWGGVEDILVRKAAEGVDVRLIYDDFGSLLGLPSDFVVRMERAHIRCIPFNPVVPLVSLVMNHRDHRKIVVIDGEIAYTGGMNIADYYINGLPKIGTWRDMHMRIEGDAVNDLQEIFLTIWNKETKQNIGGEIYFPQHEDSTNIVVAIVDRTPKKNSRMLSHAYAMSIYSAQKNVHIVNPYFVPTSSIKKALNRTIDRGVNVTIMVSSASDIPFTPDAALYKLHKLMKRGATVYMYNGGFHHSKIMMIDDLFCTVGTANLNSRSLRYDYETNAFIFDKKTTAELNTMFRNDIEHCTQLTPEFWKKRSPWKKFVGWFANLFTPFL